MPASAGFAGATQADVDAQDVEPDLAARPIQTERSGTSAVKTPSRKPIASGRAAAATLGTPRTSSTAATSETAPRRKAAVKAPEDRTASCARCRVSPIRRRARRFVLTLLARRHTINRRGPSAAARYGAATPTSKRTKTMNLRDGMGCAS